MSASRRAKRQLIAQRMSARLQAGEVAVDRALHELGLLCAELPQLPSEAQLSSTVGQELFESVSKAYSAQAEARRCVVELHHGFERVRLQLGLTPVTAGGGLDKPPQDESVVAAQPFSTAA